MEKIVNSAGTEFSLAQWDFIVNAMDDEIREKVHAEVAPCTWQEFFSAYAAAHLAQTGEQWELDKANPVW